MKRENDVEPQAIRYYINIFKQKKQGLAQIV